MTDVWQIKQTFSLFINELKPRPQGFRVRKEMWLLRWYFLLPTTLKDKKTAKCHPVFPVDPCS